MTIERLPGYDTLVGRSTAEEHRARMARPDTAHWLAARDGDAADHVRGFAILTGLADRHGGVYLLRIAVAEPGQGFGRDLLERLLDWTFREIGAPRFSLDVFAHNERARRAYRACGLREEGILRGAFEMPDGSRADRVIMAVLASERA